MKVRWNYLMLYSTLMVVLFSFAQPGESTQTSGQDFPERAKAIHEAAITLDTHVDIAGSQYATAALDPGSEDSGLKCDLPKMERGGLDGVFLAVFVGQGDLTPEGFQNAYDLAMAKFEAIHRLTHEMYPDRCELATTPDDVERISKTGKRVIMIGIENGYTIGKDITLVKKYYDLGARYITLSHSSHNQICDSSSPAEPMHNGLTEFGREVVAEMNRLGIMVDVSHIAEKSYWDVMEVTKAPIIASHSGCASLNPHDRNLNDDQLKALVRNGGVIQIVALGDYLKEATPERRDAIQKLREELGYRRMSREEQQNMTDEDRAEYQKMMEIYREQMADIDKQFPGATVADFVDHIDHAVEVAGIDHVGIGTDFDGGGGINGFNDHSECLAVTEELLRRGYSQEDINKIWGENLLRVWRDVERIAGELSTSGQ